jgi:hypothetical protein
MRSARRSDFCIIIPAKAGIRLQFATHFVMRGLDPRICLKLGDEMAGSSPAMTNERRAPG